MRPFNLLFLLLLFSSCIKLNDERLCNDYRTGNFQSSITINDIEYISKFSRNDSIQVEVFNNKIDSSYVRWINDCEVIFKTINPKSINERKSIHLKILKTGNNYYEFEYSYVGESKKQSGKAVKIN